VLLEAIELVEVVAVAVELDVITVMEDEDVT
jgi:hypothetical protein